MKKVIVKLKLKSRDEFEKKITEMDKDFLPMYWLHERVYVPRNYRKKSSFPRLILKTEMHAVDRPAKYEMQYPIPKYPFNLLLRDRKSVV